MPFFTRVEQLINHVRLRVVGAVNDVSNKHVGKFVLAPMMERFVRAVASRGVSTTSPVQSLS